jgi:hypothetical protein
MDNKYPKRLIIAIILGKIEARYLSSTILRRKNYE